MRVSYTGSRKVVVGPPGSCGFQVDGTGPEVATVRPSEPPELPLSPELDDPQAARPTVSATAPHAATAARRLGTDLDRCTWGLLRVVVGAGRHRLGSAGGVLRHG